MKEFAKLEREVISKVVDAFEKSVNNVNSTSNTLEIDNLDLHTLLMCVKFYCCIGLKNEKHTIITKIPTDKNKVPCKWFCKKIKHNENVIKNMNRCKFATIEVLNIIHFLAKLERENLILIIPHESSFFDYSNDWIDNSGLYTIEDEYTISLIKRFWDCNIIPTVELINIKKRGFKTEQRMQFIRSQIGTWTAIFVTLVFSILSLILSNNASQQSIKIEQTQIDSLINTIKSAEAKGHKIDIIEKDTLVLNKQHNYE